MHRYKLLCVVLATCGTVATLPARAETRGYVISWFATATNLDVVAFKDNCPEDRNKGRIEWYIRDLIAAGYTREDAIKIISEASDSVQLPPEVMRKMEGRAMVNGKHVSIYNYPDAVPDPNIETVTGKYAYGFDLGGSPANKFIDPETHEKVDNQLWRAVGCLESFNDVPPRPPYYEERMADSPAWALQISGADLSKDGPVTVTLSLTTQRLERDATTEVVKRAGYIIDHSPRSYNVFQGEIKNGVLSIKPAFLHLAASRYNPLELRNLHIRIRPQGDGLIGYWGGYMKWLPFVYTYTSDPPNGADTLGLYHAVKNMADAGMDPKTGQNQEISTAFRMEAVPATIFDVDGRVLAPAAPPNAQLGRRDVD